MRPERVSNEPLRKAFLAANITQAEVCRRLGWIRTDRKGGVDTTRLMRHLGLRPSRRETRSGEVRWTHATTVTSGHARLICEAMCIDFDHMYPQLPEPKVAGRCVECGNPMMRRVPSRRCGFCLEEAALGVAA